MNPEFQRNLWLEAGPQRLTWTAVALAAVYGATLVIARSDDLRALGVAGLAVYVVAALLWGSRIAGRAVGDEVAERTWDFQRLSALEPWTMTWGKLFGATSLSWLAALSGLCFVALNVLQQDGVEAALRVVTGCVAGAVLLQAGSMAMALVGVRRARAEGRSAASRFNFGGVVGALLLVNIVGRMTPTSSLGGLSLPGLLNSGDKLWWGASLPGVWFTVLSLTAFAGWTVIAAWRLMRLELQMRNAPWAWPGFTIFAAIWTAGLSPDPQARWAIAGAVFAACAYAAAFAEPADRVRLRQFGVLVGRRRWSEAAYDMPAALPPLVLAGAAAVGFALSPHAGAMQAASLPFAVFAFLLRDLGIIAFFRFGPRPRRSDLGSVLALFLAYFVGGVVGRGLLVPSVEAAPVSVLSGASMAIGIWVLAWRRIHAGEQSDASPLPGRESSLKK